MFVILVQQTTRERKCNCHKSFSMSHSFMLKLGGCFAQSPDFQEEDESGHGEAAHINGEVADGGASLADVKLARQELEMGVLLGHKQL